ncbi:epithelial-stromal interaction protein 1 [Pempheris klunzingeri]|uniref:epithelial-stromal interaction protein 1 n=1 Tax=Pempheris klunzingeri TaxID=3127111 RepID=UPI00398116EF
MDPQDHRRDSGKQLTSSRSTGSAGGPGAGAGGRVHTPANPDGGAPDRGDQAADRRPCYSDGFTMMPPNETQRSKLKMMAQKEEEDLQRWREANRVSSLHLNPEKLGGNVTLADAREQQFADLRCSKLQKKLRKEELDKRRRREEEEELQKMKAKQREKAERLEESRRQQEQRRGEQLMQDHLRAKESFLQRFERRAPGPLASSSATHTSSRNEAVESKQLKSEREVQQEHRRVNSAFLDKLEGRGSEGETRGEGIREAERPSLAREDFRHQPSGPPRQQLPLAHLNPDPERSCFDWTEEADPEADYDWALMKLMNNFPDCCKVFLEDILSQCDGDYEQAYKLLVCTFS